MALYSGETKRVFATVTDEQGVAYDPAGGVFFTVIFPDLTKEVYNGVKTGVGEYEATVDFISAVTGEGVVVAKAVDGSWVDKSTLDFFLENLND